ncbi:isochorismate synthase [Shewanella sp. AS16]|uniref:isochorismate synthase n=1 Tax=Shewanella sp. AS16 TaxID=2907625 RepID=UPI001F019006|nr:isochorismate synthase [Shewanella sp. AS16]MCE9686178.1 isochorismate synthase [Shewanella sp. AS16]
MSTAVFLAALGTLEDRLKRLPASSQPRLRLTVDCGAVNPMEWLAGQALYPRLYWCGRDNGEEVAAVGICQDFRFESADDPGLAALLQHTAAHTGNARLYGGVAFDATGPAWSEFGYARFVLPRVELTRRAGNYQLSVNLNSENAGLAAEREAALAALLSLLPPRPLPQREASAVVGRSHNPEFPRWQTLVTQITSANFNRHTPKVVLARQTRLDFERDLCPWSLLRRWQQLNPGCFQFGFQFGPGASFISCSPERLYLRRRNLLQSEALAGTARRGANEAEDTSLANELLADSKNAEENLWVKQDILTALAPLSERVEAEAHPRIFKLAHVQHLHTSIHARLKRETGDRQLLQALHPTPAVGGYPRQSAMTFIRGHETEPRGWYAGACGYLSADETEFAVAIRSAYLQGKQVCLYAGAGIVAGSRPEAEWRELDNKLATVLSILLDGKALA